MWNSDCTGISFAHSKEDQEGEDRRKRKPRHCYANGFDWEADYQSATFDYLCCFPEVMGDPLGQLFVGTEDASSKKFYNAMIRILKNHRIELQQKFGFEVEDLGVHSWRKGAHTYMNSGSTAGPSAAATCIRGGHTMGAVRDIYVLHEKAGDHYCGRILAGLPINEAKFAASHPDFIPVEAGMTDACFLLKQGEVDSEVDRALDTIFGRRQINRLVNIRPFLRVGLATHLQHRIELAKAYPPEAHIRTTTLFTSATIFELKKFVKITMPWDNEGRKAFATGIPPHTILLSGNEEIKGILKELVPNIEKCMDDRTMSGNLSEARMRTIVNTQCTGFTKEMAEIKKILLEQNSTSTDNRRIGSGTADGFKRWEIGGFFRRVPENWIFPFGPVLSIYLYWHHGDEVKGISPMKYIQKYDLMWVKNKKKRYAKNLEECQFVFKKLDFEASRKGLLPKYNLSRDDTIQIYYATKHVLGIPDTTPKGRKRNWSKLAWSSVARLTPEKKRNKKQ